MTSTSIVSMPAMWRGRSRSVEGSVSASFKHGIWMMSFVMSAPRLQPCAPAPVGRGFSSGDELLNDAVPCHEARTSAGVAEPGQAAGRLQRLTAAATASGSARHEPWFRLT